MEHITQRTPQQEVSSIIPEKDASESETKADSPEPHQLPKSPSPFGGGSAGDNHTQPISRTLKPLLAGYHIDTPSALPSPLIANRRVYDISLLFGIIVMLWWPWIFWGVVFRVRGVRMSGRVASLIINHPPYVNFFVTLVGNLVALVVDVLFSLSVVRYGQEWMAATQEVTVFQVSVLSAFRHQSWPWLIKDTKIVFGRERWLAGVLVVVCIGAFTFVTSSTAALLSPVAFNKTVALTGSELDLASTASDCVQFLDAHPLSNNCDWLVKLGISYTTCLGVSHRVDSLESGCVNMLSLLSNSSESLTFTQFGNKPGLRFLGPNRGILPVGPDSPVPTLHTIQHDLLSEAQTRVSILSYNYTLELQGMSSNVSCIYDTHSPIEFHSTAETEGPNLQYNGTCPPGQIGFLGMHRFPVVVSMYADNGLAYWACKSLPNPQQPQSYSIYLRGRLDYAHQIGNITCTISQVQLGVFPVTYQPQASVFSVKAPIATNQIMYHRLMEYALEGLGDIFIKSQIGGANVVVEEIDTYAVRYFGLKQYTQSPGHLYLYEAVTQGMVEYEMAYLRLIYSMIEDLPTSCFREVGGTVDLQVTGWLAKMEHVGFLLPMTFINLTSLALIVIVLVKADGRGYDFDPTEMRRILTARVEGHQSHSDVWNGRVAYLNHRKTSSSRRGACLTVD